MDGDHFNPQVTMDVISAYYLIKKGGLLFCDDICFDKSNRTDGFGPINYLTKISKIETTYFLKRITKNNLIFKKYVSCSKKK